MESFIISITGSNEELYDLFNKLKEATPLMYHTDLHGAKVEGKIGSITLLRTSSNRSLSYFPNLDYEDMRAYDKCYTLNNIHHFATFMYKVKEVHDELKSQRLEENG